MLRKPLFWIVLIILVAIIWFVYMGRTKTTVDQTSTMGTPSATQPAQPPASTPTTSPDSTTQPGQNQ